MISNNPEMIALQICEGLFQVTGAYLWRQSPDALKRTLESLIRLQHQIESEQQSKTELDEKKQKLLRLIQAMTMIKDYSRKHHFKL